MSCRSMWEKLTRRNDHDQDGPGGNRGATSNYLPAAPQSGGIQTLQQSAPQHTSNNGFVMKNRMTLKGAAGMVFNLPKPKSVVKFFARPGFAPNAQENVDTVQENADSVKSEPPAQQTLTVNPVQTEPPSGASPQRFSFF